MMKIGAIALFGCLAGSLALSAPARAADTPAFVNATMCDVAAPATAETAVFGRRIRAEIPVARRPAAPPRRHAAAQNRRPPARSTSRPPQRQVERIEAPVVESEAVLRPAVHFCVTPSGGNGPIRIT